MNRDTGWVESERMLLFEKAPDFVPKLFVWSYFNLYIISFNYSFNEEHLRSILKSGMVVTIVVR